MRTIIAKRWCTGFFLLVACARPGAGAPAARVVEADTAPPAAAGRLPDTVTPLAYQVAFNIDPNNARFAGQSRIAVRINRPARTLWLHGQGLDVLAATVQVAGAKPLPATYAQVTPEGLARVDLPEVLPTGLATLSFAYDAPLDTHLEGLYKVVSEGAPYVYSQFAPTAARRAFVGFDEPRFKAPFEIAVVVPMGTVAVSNTLPMAEHQAEGDPTHKTITFLPTPPLPTYLVAMAVGPFDVVDATALPSNGRRSAEVPVRGVAARGQGPHLAQALTWGQGLTASLEDYFEVGYPFAKLDFLAVPDFAAGAMENAGAITFRDWLLLYDPATASVAQKRDSIYVIAHELAHQWFGDLVTMPWWDDIWLNEAFATWLGGRVAHAFDPNVHLDTHVLMGTHGAMNVDSLQSARSVRQPAHTTNDIFSAFDAITYQKGAQVLAMFDNYVGSDRMREGITAYLQRYQFASAQADQFFAAISQAAGHDVAPAFKSFVDQPGVPQVHVELACEAGKAQLRLQQSRYRPVGSAVPEGGAWRIPVCWRTNLDGGKQSCAMLSEATAQVALSACPQWVMPNSNAAGYFRFSLSKPLWQALPAGTLPAREQLAVIDSLGAGFAAHTLEAQDVLPQLAHLAASPERAVVAATMGLIHHLHSALAGDAERPRIEAYVRRVYGPRVKELGLTPRPGEPAERGALRAQILGFVALLGQDTALHGKLAGLGEAYLGFGKDGHWHPEAAPADLAELAVTCAAEARGPKYTEAALRHLESASDATLRRVLASALGAVRTPADVELVRAASLLGKVRSNEVMTLFARGFGNPELREGAWNHFVNHYDAYVQLLPSHTLGRLPQMAASFCGADDVHRVRSFFADRVGGLPGGERALAQATEHIALCHAEREAQLAGVQKFFQGG